METAMWKMFDNDITHCCHCNDLLDQPPKFMIPPPPLPPSLIDYRLNDCSEENQANEMQQPGDRNMCEALPIFDSGFYSNQTLQTSAIIAVLSLMLVLLVLISSLFVWKNKRKVQNILPCKSSARGPHINGGLPLGGMHIATYEDANTHLVMRHHQNVELLNGEGIHYPSGYPMTRSPPFLVSSSPGPDPYRSNENVYEELDPGRDSEGESEPGMDSGDEFAEDELSWSGERSFVKSGRAPNTLPVGVSAVAQEQNGQYTAVTPASSASVRNSLISSSSSPQDQSSATTRSSNSYQSERNISAKSPKTPSARITNRIVPGILQPALSCGRVQKKSYPISSTLNRISGYSSTVINADHAHLEPIQQMYDKRSNLISLSYIKQSHTQHTAHFPHFHSLSHVQKPRVVPNKIQSTVPHLCRTLGDDAGRRNRFNAQLKQAAAPVATIFRECILHPGRERHSHTNSKSANVLGGTLRPHVGTHSIDRHRRVCAPVNPVKPAYAYDEPAFSRNHRHENNLATKRFIQQRPLAHPATYIIPEYACVSTTLNTSAIYQNANQCAGVEDGSLGSDSGYSHHTPASSIGQQDYDTVLPLPSTQLLKSTNRLSPALSNAWNRRKPTACATSADLSVHHHHSDMSPKTTDTSSPNNNNTDRTTSSSLEVPDHCIGEARQKDNNNSSYQAYTEQA